jgi:hypothetical protein
LLVNADSPPAFALGDTEGGIRSAQQRVLGANVAARKERHADGEADGMAARRLGQHWTLGHVAKDPLRDLDRAREVHARQHGEELVTTEAGDHVALPRGAPDRVGHLPYHTVALISTSELVIKLQAVDVDREAREGLLMSLRALELLAEPRVQVAVIVKPGEIVVNAQLLEALASLDDVVVQALDAQHGFDASHELAFVEGLAHVVVGTDTEALHPACAVRLHGQEQHGQERTARHALQEAARFESAEPRHEHVEQYEVHAAARDALDGRLAVGNGFDVVTPRAQHARHELARQSIVVGDDQRSAAVGDGARVAGYHPSVPPSVRRPRPERGDA